QRLDRLGQVGQAGAADGDPGVAPQPPRERIRGRLRAATDGPLDPGGDRPALPLARVHRASPGVAGAGPPRPLAAGACVAISIRASVSRINATRPSPRILAPDSPRT